MHSLQLVKLLSDSILPKLMKIGISGAGGIGKTTLIAKIAPAGGYPIIPDVIDDILCERGYKNFGDVLEKEEHADIRMTALRRKIDLERASKDFITDKTVCDYYAYWLLRTAPFASLEQNVLFASQVREHITFYDRVFIPKFGQFPLADNGLRSTDYSHQYRVHCLIKGIYSEEGVAFQEVIHTLDEPVEQVLRRMGLG